MNLEFKAYPQTGNFYILFIPGDTGDAAGHNLKHVKRLWVLTMRKFQSPLCSGCLHA